MVVWVEGWGLRGKGGGVAPFPRKRVNLRRLFYKLNKKNYIKKITQYY